MGNVGYLSLWNKVGQKFNKCLETEGDLHLVQYFMKKYFDYSGKHFLVSEVKTNVEPNLGNLNISIPQNKLKQMFAMIHTSGSDEWIKTCNIDELKWFI